MTFKVIIIFKVRCGIVQNYFLIRWMLKQPLLGIKKTTTVKYLMTYYLLSTKRHTFIDWLWSCSTVAVEHHFNTRWQRTMMQQQYFTTSFRLGHKTNFLDIFNMVIRETTSLFAQLLTFVLYWRPCLAWTQHLLYKLIIPCTILSFHLPGNVIQPLVDNVCIMVHTRKLITWRCLFWIPPHKYSNK